MNLTCINENVICLEKNYLKCGVVCAATHDLFATATFLVTLGTV